ncbi:MAG: aspartate aminotransferase [Clostridiales bacterium]|nr:MAG: aspartate aminotransferase [Clostridiales bacterium]
MQVSKRIQNLQASPIRNLVPLADAAKEKGTKVYHLNIGQPDIETPSVFFDAIKTFDKNILAYANSRGDKDLIGSIIKYYKRYNLDFNLENIVITNGGSEAISLTLTAITDYGDEIIIPEPYYTNYNGFATPCGVNIKSITTKAENGFKLPDVSEWEKLITDKTKAILISNPCNPTGSNLDEREIEIIKELAFKYNLYVICDEVYREFIYDGDEFRSVATIKELQDRVIIIDSISKRFSACGARIGNIAAFNVELINSIMKLCQARLCVPTIEQLGARALYELPSNYFDFVLVEYKERRDILFEHLMKIEGIKCVKPRGAFYLMADLPVEDATDFVKFLLTDFSDNGETVMMTPTEKFYSTKGVGKNQVRLAYILNKTDLIRSMEILKKGLESYKNR